jgi:DNA-3-methyladenine glycosylase II
MYIINNQTLHDGVQYLTGIDASFSNVINTYGIPPLWLRTPGFATLLLIILEQQVSLQSARAAFERLESRLGIITPQGFLGIDDLELRTIGFSRQKTGYCRELAGRIVDKTLELERLPTMDTEDVIEYLTIIKGIGQWTARIYLIMALRRSDIWPSGDLALRKAYARLKHLPVIPDDRFMEAEAEQWKPWRAVAARILWHYYLSQDKKPVI